MEHRHRCIWSHSLVVVLLVVDVAVVTLVAVLSGWRRRCCRAGGRGGICWCWARGLWCCWCFLLCIWTRGISRRKWRSWVFMGISSAEYCRRQDRNCSPSVDNSNRMRQRKNVVEFFVMDTHLPNKRICRVADSIPALRIKYFNGFIPLYVLSSNSEVRNVLVVTISSWCSLCDILVISRFEARRIRRKETL